MWLKLLENFGLGFAISAVPGAVFVETIRRTLFDKQTIIKFLAGNLVGMLIIVVAVFSGLAVLIHDRSATNVFYGLGGSVLVLLGLSSIITKPNYHPKTAKVSANQSNYTAFATGLLLSVANPLGIIFWIAIIGRVIQDTGSIAVAVLNSLSVVVGSLVLFIILVTILNVLPIKVNVRHLTWLARVFGIVIVLYGLVAFSKIS